MNIKEKNLIFEMDINKNAIKIFIDQFTEYYKMKLYDGASKLNKKVKLDEIFLNDDDMRICITGGISQILEETTKNMTSVIAEHLHDNKNKDSIKLTISHSNSDADEKQYIFDAKKLDKKINKENEKNNENDKIKKEN